VPHTIVISSVMVSLHQARLVHTGFKSFVFLTSHLPAKAEQPTPICPEKKSSKTCIVTLDNLNILDFVLY
jgi:hypothetical protein